MTCTLQSYYCTVQEIVSALPELLGPIQGQLLDLLSLVLARRPHRENLPQLHLNALHHAIAHGAPPCIPQVHTMHISAFVRHRSLLPNLKGLEACPRFNTVPRNTNFISIFAVSLR